MIKETGGQAFPRQQWDYDGQNNVLQYQEEGMTLRDYFAARAMQSIIDRYQGKGFGGRASSHQLSDVAEQSYFMADAMLKARGEQS